MSEVELKCKRCGKEFSKGRWKTQVYCSPDCRRRYFNERNLAILRKAKEVANGEERT